MSTPGKPRFEFFSKRVLIFTGIVTAGTWYYYIYRPVAQRKKHLYLEQTAQEYWALENAQKSSSPKD